MATIDLPMPMPVRVERRRAAGTTGWQADLLAVAGDVRLDEGARAAYATDSSNYRQVPLAVVTPRTVAEAVAVIEVCHRHRVPLLSRGGGTSLAGQTTNAAVVLDWTKHCNRLVSTDADARTCVVEPGIALDDLNRALAPHRLMFGPRPSTHRSCTLGGMIGNNSCGATAQAYGKTVDNVRRLEVLTVDGARFWAGPTDEAAYTALVDRDDRVADIYRTLRELGEENRDEIRARYPDIPRRVSGYNLDSLLPERGFDIARALVGSEGTLVTVLHAELDLVPVPEAKALVVLGYPDIATAADAVPAVLRHDPWQLEGMDDILVNLDRELGVAEDAIQGLPTGGGWLMVQFIGEDQDEADRKAQSLLDAMRARDPAPHCSLIDDPAKEARLQDVREAGLGSTAHPPQQHETWEGWEDSAVPPEHLGEYLRQLRALMNKFGYPTGETSLYGHFGQGCVHTRIPFELRTADGIARYRAFVEQAAGLVIAHGGSLSGEHGDGQSRGELLIRMFGAQIVSAFGQLKKLFDPDNLMNPGKVVHANPLDSHLRLGTDFAPEEPKTFFAFPDDDNKFSKVARRCVGVGNCRNSSSDEQVMCPSYMVTREEEHSTRGRARLLFEMIRGETITDGWRSTEVRDALDLCLACKGCKSDCPVNVDMATYKAEFLAHHYAGRVRPAAHYSMGWLPVWARMAAVAPGPLNAALKVPPLAAAAKRLGGVAPQRELPAFAPQRFTDWWQSRPKTGNKAPRGRVLLWPDTFTNSFSPEVGRSAVNVLTDAGFQVVVPTQPLCCGLTWISTGQLRIARRVLRRTVAALRPYLRAGVPVVGLEPSCTAVFRSDGTDLLPGDEDMRRLSLQTRTLAELLLERAPEWHPPLRGGEAIIQTHCHQHAVLSTNADDELLERAGVSAERLGSGCCGLAGNFGFEKGHYEVSMAAAERVLLPRLRNAPPTTTVLADGFSCRTQIQQGTDGSRRAVHLAQLLAGDLP
ncbi:MAG TPA: FAD-binding and (Fe-S)-binding domain-containing protein [Sporichthyaceae bacterium]